MVQVYKLMQLQIYIKSCNISFNPNKKHMSEMKPLHRVSATWHHEGTVYNNPINPVHYAFHEYNSLNYIRRFVVKVYHMIARTVVEARALLGSGIVRLNLEHWAWKACASQNYDVITSSLNKVRRPYALKRLGCAEAEWKNCFSSGYLILKNF